MTYLNIGFIILYKETIHEILDSYICTHNKNILYNNTTSTFNMLIANVYIYCSFSSHIKNEMVQSESVFLLSQNFIIIIIIT